MLLARLFAGLFSQQDVNLLLDPVLVVRRVGERLLVEHEAAEVGELVDEVEQMADVVGDGRRVGIEALEVLFVHLADALQTVVDCLVV